MNTVLQCVGLSKDKVAITNPVWGWGRTTLTI